MEDRCDGCGYDGRPLGVPEVAAALVRVPGEVRGVVAGAPDASLRRRPAEGGWSAVEYLGHLRDLMAFHRWLVERALAEVEPAIDAVDPDAAVAAAGYQSADPDELVDQLDRRVTRLADALRGLDADALRRPLQFPGAGRIDVALVARSALHEAHHHLGDLRRLLASSAPG